VTHKDFTFSGHVNIEEDMNQLGRGSSPGDDASGLWAQGVPVIIRGFWPSDVWEAWWDVMFDANNIEGSVKTIVRMAPTFRTAIFSCLQISELLRLTNTNITSIIPFDVIPDVIDVPHRQDIRLCACHPRAFPEYNLRTMERSPVHKWCQSSETGIILLRWAALTPSVATPRDVGASKPVQSLSAFAGLCVHIITQVQTGSKL
jgi:hypothetical protein